MYYSPDCLWAARTRTRPNITEGQREYYNSLVKGLFYYYITEAIAWYVRIISRLHGDDLDNDVILPTHDLRSNIRRIGVHTLLIYSFYCSTANTTRSISHVP